MAEKKTTNWTPDQELAICTHGCNLLVSAAAGSGKTAVLVERIIRMITDDKHPVDIDRLMVVTFTNAAAGEMKERILAAVEKKLNEQPDNLHLQRQMTYVYHANITTLHSFCMKVIRENFDRISVDPGFRVGESGELELIRQDALAEVIEAAYENGTEEFYRFAESYAPEKSDAILNELILTLFDAAQSRPDPEAWLSSLTEDTPAYGQGRAQKTPDTQTGGQDASLKTADEKEEISRLLNSLWMNQMLAHTSDMLEDIARRIRQAIALSESHDGPTAYLPVLRQELAAAERLCGCQTYEEYHNVFGTLNFARLKAVSKKDLVDPQKKERVRSLRDAWKDQLTKMRDTWFSKELRDILAEEQLGREPLAVLTGLVKEFAKTYRERKADKNLVDFNDLEHLALSVLCDRTDDGTLISSAVGQSMAAEIEEIMVDEYQDINLLQDAIIKSVSRESMGTPNVFMVGDVKQSIYRFRLARPELFMEKYNTYRDSGAYRRVILGQNFRSRAAVLNDINFLFRQIMTKELGGISYDAKQALVPGAAYPELPAGQDNRTELCLITADEEVLSPSGSDGTRTEMPFDGSLPSGDDAPEAPAPAELEGMFIADKIRRMMQQHFQVFDRQAHSMRDMTPGDVVVLVRTMKGYGETIADTLMACGVPAYCETTTGYFNTVEVRTLLHLLKALDNPRDEVSLAAVLKSPIGGFSSEDLAWIRADGGNGNFYDCCRNYDVPGDRKDRLTAFFKRFDAYRTQVPLVSLYQLMDDILEDTGYRYYVAAMPSGERRLKNIEMLMEKAAVYEENSYRGLFRFVRYIEKLREYEVDFGEAPADALEAGHVRVMSIHKSKGLEFPVVFVAGVARSFNFTDSSRTLLIHPDLGIGTDSFDPEKRLIYRTLKKKIIGDAISEDRLAEELCVLYVAATRAKEKLLFVGCQKDRMREKIEKISYLAEEESIALPFAALRGARSFLDFLMMGLLRSSCMRDLLVRCGQTPPDHPLAEEKTALSFTLIPEKSLLRHPEQEERGMRTQLNRLSAWEHEPYEITADPFSCDYPYQEATTLIGKYSVSDVKHRYMDQELPEEDDALMSQLPVWPEDGAAKDNAGSHRSESGSLRGTAFHKVLELWDYLLPLTDEDGVRSRVGEMAAQGRIPAEYADLADPALLADFFSSELGLRMKRAAEGGKLMRESQFVMGVPANEIGLSASSEEMILIQGMVDACFEENGGLILVDYKTDRLHTREAFLSRYQVQLELYAHALEAAYKKPVRQMLIYSFEMEKEIAL